MEQNNQGAAKVVTAFVTFQEESSKVGEAASSSGTACSLPPRRCHPGRAREAALVLRQAMGLRAGDLALLARGELLAGGGPRKPCLFPASSSMRPCPFHGASNA
jgi:hypothetical protein